MTRTRKPRDRCRTRFRGTLLQQWVDESYRLARKPADFYCGCRKIFRGVRLSFPIDDSLKLSHSGYTSNKMRQLERHYIHQESIDVASRLWDERLKKKKYGSVGFTCYNHFIKAERTSKRASVMGPCIQSVTLTWVNRDEVAIDAFYRTTELFKKFPADLVFIRDRLLTQFNMPNEADVTLTCHFANVTAHPMYFVVLLPLLDDPLRRLAELREQDRHFHDWVVKWTARYVCPEFHHGIEKFAQAMRVKDHADKVIKGSSIKKYLRKFHPGYRGDTVSNDCDDD